MTILGKLGAPANHYVNPINAYFHREPRRKSATLSQKAMAKNRFAAESDASVFCADASWR
jgi:hypothetical protein